MLIRTVFTISMLAAACANATVGPWPDGQDTLACNAGKQVDKTPLFPATIVRCDEMNNPTSACLELCETCQEECTEGIEDGYFQFYLLGGTAPAQCACYVLEKEGDTGGAASITATTIAVATTTAVITMIAN